MYRVILVDDEAWVLQGLALLIKRMSTRLEVIGMYEDPEQAIQEVERLRPDVIFTDVRMPEMSGIELIRTLRERHMDIEAVIVSAHQSFEAARDAIDLDVRQYLLKPFQKAEVQKVLDKIVQRLDEKAGQPPAERALRSRSAATLPFCCVLLVQDDGCMLQGEPGMMFEEYDAPGFSDAYLCSFEHRYQHKKLAEILDGTAVGMSTVHPDFTEIDAMLAEASVSLLGGFHYSDNEQIVRVQRFLYDLNSQKVDTKGIAEQFFLSHGYLSTLFKKETGTTMVSFFHQVHMRRAASYLETSNKKLTQIAEDVGYTDYNYFARMFKRVHGVSPESYRRAKWTQGKEMY